MSDVFRSEAREHKGRMPHGDDDAVLRLPRWAQWTSRLLLALVTLAFVFSIVASAPEYVDGVALIRARERVSMTSPVAGTVDTVSTVHGASVVAGDVLVTLRTTDEQAQLLSLQSEFDFALTRMLADPRAQSVRDTLGSLRARRDVAHAAIEARVFRATRSGLIGDVRVSPGQVVSPGDVVVSLVPLRPSFEVVALIPGYQQPALRVGQSMNMVVSGYADTHQPVQVITVGEEVLGQTEIRRVLGPEASDLAQATDSVVLVHGALDHTTFESRGTIYPYADGMRATVRLRLRSGSLLARLLPSLRSLPEMFR